MRLNAVYVVFVLLILALVSLALAQATPLYALPSADTRLVTSNSIAITSNARFAIAANMLNNTVSIVELGGQNQVRAELPVGRDPRTVALVPDESQVLAVSRGDGTIAVINMVEQVVTATYPIGILPYGVVIRDATSAFVALQGTSEVVLFEISTGQILQRIPTPPDPAGLALWGDFLYVSHLWNGELSLIYLPQMQVVRTVSAGNDVAISQAITIDPQRGFAYLPQTRLNAQSQATTFDTLVFPVVNVFDLREMSLEREARLTLDTGDRPVNMPFSAVLDGQRRWLYVANAGSNDVSVMDLVSGLSVAHIPVGTNPRGLLLSRDAGTLYIHNMIDGTLTTVNTNTFDVINEILISDLTISADVLIGATLFHTSEDARLTEDHWVSCASCHFDGQSDGRVWYGYTGEARNTPVLYHLSDRIPYTWTGRWNELADMEEKIRWLHAGSGLIETMMNPVDGDNNSGLSPDLDTLSAYLLTLESPPAPPVADPILIERGAQIFTEQNCASCHSGAFGTDGLRYDVGTGDEIVTPALLSLWQSAPYFHDGSAMTLEDVFILPGAHQLIRTIEFSEIEALAAYLKTLPSR
ncbi:MAG: hypothetical protein MUF87_07160 [Anaerolineae bacterium]|jgi:YVTN family beta-propeller protein|nr:hypothetical protein [Anaerolineae bacterium]